MIDAAINFLLETRNADGGWGAGQGKRSNPEATALSVVGLSTVQDRALRHHIDQGLSWLSKRQSADGSWPFTDRLTEGSWATALATLSLSCFETHRRQALRGAEWLLRQKGRAFGWITALRYWWAPHTLDNRFNPNLQGWSWTPNAFSWVEPTAYALMALKKLKPLLQGTSAGERIHEGELLLYDRMCKGGGWNYGNSVVLGEDLSPYPDTTAVTLIALHDRQTEAANQQSLNALRHLLTHVTTSLTLSWSILCFALYGQDISDWQTLLARNHEQTGFLGETKTIALALLALSEEGVKIFRV